MFSLDCMALPQTYRVWFSGEGPRNLHECLWVILWPSIVWEPLLFFFTDCPPSFFPPSIPSSSYSTFPKSSVQGVFSFYCALPGLGTSILWLEHTALDPLLPVQALFETPKLGYSGVSVVKNPPANAGDVDLVPDPTRSHMPQNS